MSSVTGINGSLIGEIAKSSKGSSSETSKSTLLGKEVSTSFDSVSFNPEIFKQAFADSYIRINNAVNVVRQTDETLEKLLKITDDLLKIAHHSAQREVSDAERGRLETRFQKLIIQFKDTVAEANTKGIDFLDKDELASILSKSGIDLSAASELADMFSKIAGSNTKIGRRPVKLDDEFVDNGTSTINVSVSTFVPGSGGGIINQVPNTGGPAGNGTYDSSQITSSFISDPLSVVVSDYNGDGLDDVASVSWDSDQVQVFFGNGDGTLKAGVTYNVGNGPIRIRKGDLNGDGSDDLVTVNEYAGTVSVLLNNGDGNFKAAVSYSATAAGVYRMKDVAVGDVNGDGQMDLVALDYTGQTANVLIGTGSGSFMSPTSFALGGSGLSLKLTDIDNDNKLDVVFNDFTNSAVRTFLGNGDGTFAIGISFASNSGADMAIGDFNNDGNKDFALAGSSPDSIDVYLGNGNGTFKSRQSYLTGGGPVAIEAVDINEDGYDDLAVGTVNGGYVGVFLANSNGSFKARLQFDDIGVAEAIAFGDFNNDGVVDLVTGDQNLGRVTINLGRPDLPSFEGTGSYAANTSFNLSTGAITDMINGDIDNDGFEDWIYESGGNMVVVRNNGDGTFGATGTYALPAFGYMSLVDLNNDGFQDLFTQNGTEFNTWINNGDGTFGARTSTAAGGTINYRGEFADINGDGREDWIGVIGSNLVAWQNYGNGYFAPTPNVIDSSGTYTEIEVGDINNDGKADIVTASSVFQQVNFYLGNGNATFQPVYTIASADPRGLLLADVNADGYDDVVTANTFANTATIFINNGDGSYNARSTYDISGVGTAGDGKLYQYDVNGDGIQDLIIGSGGTSASILIGNGQGTFNPYLTVNFSANATQSLTLGDFDGDGVKDLVAARLIGIESKKLVSRQVMSGTGSFTFGMQIDMPGTTSAIELADLNKDGYLDIISSDDTAGSVTVNLGRADGTFGPTVSYSAGIGGTSADIAIGDFNGDGRLDFATGFGGGTTTAALGNGDGSFGAAVATYGFFMDNISGVRTADFNQDGFDDLIWYGSSGAVGYQQSNGDGTFKASVGTGVQGNAGVQIADFNNDGFQDIAGINSDGGSGHISIVYGNGNGTFQAPQSIAGFEPGAGNFSASVGDFDNDGKLDFAYSSNFFGGQVSHNLGSSFAAPSWIVNTAVTGESMSVGDVNNDGKADLITLDPTAGNIYVNLGNGDMTFQGPITYSGSLTDAQSLKLADFNRDGVLDAAIANRTGGALTILYGEATAASNFGDGTLQPVIHNYSDGGAPNEGAFLADFNGDGNLDLTTISGATAGVPNGTFTTQPTISLTNYSSVAGGDFNQDGYTDFVVGDENSGGAKLYLGNNNGTFKAPVSIAMASSIYTLLVSDFNNDGQLDFGSISRNGGVPALEIAFGNGDGTFEASASYGYEYSLTGGGSPGDAKVADINNDGFEDIVAVAGGTNNAVILFGNSNGSFSAPSVFNGGFGGTSFGVSVADFNSDGKNDLVYAGSSNSVVVFLGNGDGTLKSPISYNVGAGDAFKTETADLNGDNFIDIVTTNSDSTLSILYGNGDGTFNSPSQLALNSARFDLNISDLNGDGFADLVTAGSSYATFFYGNGDGTFKATVTNPNLGGNYSAIFDITNDGVLDVIVDDTLNSFIETYVQGTTAGSPKLQTMFGNGDGSFRAPTSYTVAGGTNVTGRDLNGDNILDLVVASGSDYVSVLIGNSNGSFGSSKTYTASGTAIDEVRLLDLNRDGILDMVGSSTIGAALPVFLGNSDGSFKAPTVASQGPLSSWADSVTLADFNRDGLFDLAVASKTANEINISFGTGNGAFSYQTSYSLSGNPTRIESGDINGDGIFDLITAGSGSVSVLIGNANGTFKSAVSYAGTNSIDDIQLSDFNGDGFIDVIAADDANQKLDVFLGTGSGTLKPMTSYAAGGAAHAIAIGDLNRDGSLDVINNNATGGTFSVHLGSVEGSGSRLIAPGFKDGEALENVFSGRLSEISSADFNKDGNADLVVQGDSGTSLYVLFGNGDNTFSGPYDLLPGSGGGIATYLGDVDNDGDDDIVTNNGNLTRVIKSNGNGTFAAATQVSSGVQAMDLKLADLNGDGILDLMTSDYTPSVSIYLGNGDGSFKARTSYVAAGRMITIDSGDINGDGKADIVSQNFFGVLFTSLGNGDGTFKGMVSYHDLGGATVTAMTHDFNNDGYDDVIQGASDYTSIRFGSASGTLSAQTTISSYGSTDFIIDDKDGDGKDDLILGNFDNIRLLSGNGDGTFKYTSSFVSTASTTTELVYADVNNDGLKDVLGTTYTNNVIESWLANAGTASAGTYVTSTTSSTVSNFENLTGGKYSDVMKNLSVKTRGRAVMSEKALKKIKADLQSDKKYLEAVEDQLTKALRFAVSGSVAAGTLGSGASAKALAEAIARRTAQEGINAEQQRLDTNLVSKLLSSD